MPHRALAIGAVLVALVLPACGEDDGADGDGVAAPAAETVTFTAADISFDKTAIDIPAGAVEFAIKNEGQLPHNLTVKETDVDIDVAAGEEGEADATLEAGTYQFECSVHPDLMKGTITVT